MRKEPYNESNIIGNIYNSELNIILKIALKPFYYYVIYYRYLIPLNKQKSLEVLAKEFNISRQAMESAEKRALEKVKPYLKNSCNHVLLKKFKEKIKMDIEYIKLEPLSIDAVIKYLYIKNDLTKEELKLYSLMNLSSVNYPDSFYEQKLNISLDRLKELKKVISSKLQAKMENQEAYLIFKNKLIAKNGTLIYKFVNDCEGVFLKDEIERINLNNNQEEDFNLEDIAKNRTFDLLVFLKTVLSPLCYYIFYSLYYDRQTKEQLAREIHLCYEGISADISGGIKKILKPYFSDYSKNYQEEINNLKNKYGLNYYYLKTTPLTPDDIIKYLYLKDELSFLERKIWELQLFGPFKYSPLDYSIILGLNLDECDELLKSLEEKIKNKFANVGEFKKYKEHTMDRRKGGIFRNLPSEIFLVNYDELFFKYQKLTFAEILALFTNINYLLNKEEIDLLIKFTNIAIKEELNLKERKKIISLLQILDLKLKALNLTYKK